MMLQSIFLGFLISTLYGAAFHLWRGGSLWRLGLYLVFSWIGFWGGHWLAHFVNWDFIRVGALNLGSGTLGSLLVLGVGYWLSLAQVEPAAKSTKK